MSTPKPAQKIVNFNWLKVIHPSFEVAKLPRDSSTSIHSHHARNLYYQRCLIWAASEWEKIKQALKVKGNFREKEIQTQTSYFRSRAFRILNIFQWNSGKQSFGSFAECWAIISLICAGVLLRGSKQDPFMWAWLEMFLTFDWHCRFLSVSPKRYSESSRCGYFDILRLNIHVLTLKMNYEHMRVAPVGSIAAHRGDLGPSQ